MREKESTSVHRAHETELGNIYIYIFMYKYIIIYIDLYIYISDSETQEHVECGSCMWMFSEF